MPIGIEIKDDTGEVVLNSESKVLVKLVKSYGLHKI